MAKDAQTVRSAENFYRITSYITGGMLLLLTFEMILKYFGGVEIETLQSPRVCGSGGAETLWGFMV